MTSSAKSSHQLHLVENFHGLFPRHVGIDDQTGDWRDGAIDGNQDAAAPDATHNSNIPAARIFDRPNLGYIMLDDTIGVDSSRHCQLRAESYPAGTETPWVESVYMSGSRQYFCGGDNTCSATEPSAPYQTLIAPEVSFRPPPHQHHGPDRAQDQQRDEAHDGEQSYQPHHALQLALAINFFIWLFIFHIIGWWG